MNEIAGLALATAAFVGSHLVLSHPLRRPIVQNVGEAAFTGLYSILALLTLVWMVLAYRAVNSSVPFWIAPDWWWPVAAALMLFASILLAGSLVRNPAFPHPDAPKRLAAAVPVGVYAITRHPMNWSFILWALVHISLWGSPSNLVVASGIFVLALGGSIGQDRKKEAVIGPKWIDWENRTSFVPFGALFSGKARWKTAVPGRLALIGGLLFWLLVTWLHAPSVSPLAMVLGGG